MTVVGDSKVGKTSVVLTFQEDKFPQQEALLHRTARSSVTTIIANREPYKLEIFDTLGGEEEEKRKLNYAGTNMMMICYSVVSPDSYESVEERWVPEIDKLSPKTPFIIVGRESV